MTPKQIRDAWNAQADEYNQWSELEPLPPQDIGETEGLEGHTEGAMKAYTEAWMAYTTAAVAAERERILAAASEACRPFGKTGAVVMCAIRAKSDPLQKESNQK